MQGGKRGCEVSYKNVVTRIDPIFMHEGDNEEVQEHKVTTEIDMDGIRIEEVSIGGLHNSLQKLGFDKVISSSNMGYAGGIIVTWRKDRMNITLSSKEEQSIHLRIRILTGEKWMFTFIYASPNVDMTSRLWDNLKNRARNIRSPWILAVYFNETAYANNNKFGVQASHRKCMAF
ncbi:hypothetical protein KIW84_050282 [Lathyrus oleraceus]|uniref:Uncharacterized protein n=1 Tax=Pisum sativum TaxID=3888 RepID=A0A9D5AC78_PEA|nr:hypothetical protein KIW84_050282 [Pisum sativum]